MWHLKIFRSTAGHGFQSSTIVLTNLGNWTGHIQAIICRIRSKNPQIFKQKGQKLRRIVKHEARVHTSRQEQASRLIGKMSRLWCHDLTAILLYILILIIEKIFFASLETSQFTYCKIIMYIIGSLDSLNSDCRSFSDLKTVTGSRPENRPVTNHTTCHKPRSRSLSRASTTR